eukprot:c43223_g1_i1 orf=463-2508(+)
MAQSSASVRPSSASSKAPLEEKFVHIYRDIFSGCSPIHSKNDSGIQGHAAMTRFWDELLLLKVNEAFLIQCISNLSETQLKTGMKLILNELFGTCSLYLNDGNFIRVAHSLETLMILFQEIFKKRFSEQGFTIITLIAGSVENADSYFTRLIGSVAKLLQRDDVPIPVKSLSLRLYFTILATTDNINTNVVASYFFQNNIFNAILAALSVKLTEDRRSLELDATLVLILLLLWRESRNIYVETLSSPSTPVLPLLQAAQSLMSYTKSPHLAPSSTSSLQMWSMTNSVYSYLGNLFGFSSAPADEHQGSSVTTALCSQDEFWLHTTAGVVLAHFIVYHSPLMKSTQLWPSLNDQGPGSFPQSISSLWIQLLRSCLSVCGTCFHLLAKAEAKEILQAKCCLNLLRCLVESKEGVEFLAFCDVSDFTIRNAPRGGMSGFPLAIPSKSIVCVILDNTADILCVHPASSVDPDLFNRAVVLIPIIFNCLKLRGWQLSAESIGWLRLWNGLLQVCNWAGSKDNFQRPGVAELAELVLGILESCLGSSHDICSAPKVSECLQAVVMANMGTLESLLEAATLVPLGAQSSTQWVNINSVRNHYEIQIAALGVRGCPTYEQALQGVQKKGMLSLKLKARHAGPTHAYAEGTTELRLLINTVRSLVALHRKQIHMRPPRLEISTLGQRPSV